MKVYVVQYLDYVEGISFWKFDRIFDSKEKAIEYCKKMNEKWSYRYIYDVEYVE